MIIVVLVVVAIDVVVVVVTVIYIIVVIAVAVALLQCLSMCSRPLCTSFFFLLSIQFWNVSKHFLWSFMYFYGRFLYIFLYRAQNVCVIIAVEKVNFCFCFLLIWLLLLLLDSFAVCHNRLCSCGSDHTFTHIHTPSGRIIYAYQTR